MVNNLFINGCSFLEIYDKKKCPTTVGHCLSEDFGINPISYASAGRGNDRIVATTKLFFYDNPSLVKDTFVLIGWSHVVRNDYLTLYSKLRKSPKEGICRKQVKNQFLRNIKGKNLVDGIHGDWKTWKFSQSIKRNINALPDSFCIQKNLRLRYLEQVLSLQDFFKLNNIKYCMYNALTNNYSSSKAEGLDRLADNVDKSRFFQFDTQSHLEFVEASQSSKSQHKLLALSKTDNHPNSKGHRLWADKLNIFIRENSLI